MAYLRALILGKYLNMFSGATITMMIWNVNMVRIVSDVLKTQNYLHIAIIVIIIYYYYYCYYYLCY